MPTKMMSCGHAANGTSDGQPVCVICIGIDSGAEKVSDDPDLKQRGAVCPYCKELVASSLDLPFFEYRPYAKTDSYYCGCRGWD